MSDRTAQGHSVEGHLLGRASRITRIMAKHGIREVLTPHKPGDEEAERAKARRLRGALEELGPTFCKLGQILSTRPDLLPPAFIEELATLRDRVPPMTEAEVVQVMERELRVPWEDVFETLDPQPLAAGTMAQVHRATLATGEEVVVKVQRINAETDILQDLGLLEMFADRTADRPAFRQMIDLPEAIRELSSSLKDELDLRKEANNMERLRRVLTPFPRLDVPAVFPDLITSRLLVMEFIPGGPIGSAPHGIERTEAARQLLECYYRQILTDGFFHADPHPGNLIWHDGKVYFLDCGMVGEVGPEVRELLMLLLLAFWQEDTSFVSEIVLLLAGGETAEIDMHAFESDLSKLLAQYRQASLKEIQLGPLLQELTEISIRHDVRLPASLAMTGKALAQMQLATAELDPTLDPFSVAGQYLTKSLTGRLRESINPQKFFYEAQKTRVRIVRLVEALERLVGARPGPKLQVQFRGIEPLEATIRRVGRRLAVSMAAGSALVATALTAGQSDVPAWVPASLGGTGGALIAALFVDLLRRGK